MIEDETLQRSSLMADQQDRPDEKSDATSPAPAPQFSDAEPPPAPTTPSPPADPPAPAAQKAPAKKAKAAKKAPTKTPKKTPAKVAKKAAAPAKKTAKKAVAKKAPPKPPEPKIAPKAASTLADTNGDRNIADAAKETAAQAKSAVAAAGNPVAAPRTVPWVGPDQSRLPLAAAIAAGVLAILLVIVARRHGDDAWQGIQLSAEEQVEIFGTTAFGGEYAAEADALLEALADAKRRGVEPGTPPADELAARHRASIERFYDCGDEMHRCLAEMYIADERFTRYYDDVERGLAQFLRDIVVESLNS
jgi:TipAS antibiotic-recognition protein